MLCFDVMNEEMALMQMDRLPPASQKFWTCRSFYLFISGSVGNGREAIRESETALENAPDFSPHDLFWLHYSFAEVFSKEGGPDDAHTCIVQAKSVNEARCLSHTRVLRVSTWIEQRHPERTQPLLARALGRLVVVGSLGIWN